MRNMARPCGCWSTCSGVSPVRRLTLALSAGQGKSLVLQRISGLEGDVIPSADGSDCTGARSVISNRPGMETQAEITFYSEQEFVGIVNRYLKEIFKTDIYCIGSVAEISRLNMAELKGKIRYDQVTETSLLTHLEK